MRFAGLTVALLLALPFAAPAQQNCPGTLSACPPLSAAQINLGGGIVNQAGVPFVPPAAVGTAGQVLATTGPGGVTNWESAVTALINQALYIGNAPITTTGLVNFGASIPATWNGQSTNGFFQTQINGTGSLGTSGFATLNLNYTHSSTATDGGALELNIFNSNPSASSTSRGIQIDCWGPNPCTNGIVFINEVSPGPGGYWHNGIAFNESFGNSVDIAFLTDNGSPMTPVSQKYAVWFDGSTTFSTDEYESPGFRIGPTATNYNSKIAITDSAAGSPIISVVGAGIAPAAVGNMAFQMLGSGTITINGIPAVNCPAGTLNLTTAVVTNGFFTHC